jgi:saccharopine dehydrogenase-like NADP-dependent oxidoreductase
VTRIALIGAGEASGRRLAANLLERDPSISLLVIDPDPGRAEALVAGLGGGRCTAAPMGTGPGSLAAVLGDVDAALGFLGSEVEMEVLAASGAIQAKVPYISACEFAPAVEALLALDEAAHDAGTLVVPGFGWSPGLTNLLARWGAESLDEVRSVRVAWTSSAIGEGTDATILRAVRSFSGSVAVFEDGGWHRKPGGTQSESVFFPKPLGWRRVHLCSGAEVLTLPRSLPGVSSVVVKAGVSEALADRLARGLSGLFPLAPSRRRERLAAVTRPLLPAAGRLRGSGARTWAAARVDVRGGKDGVEQVLTFGVLDQPGNLAVAPVEAAGLMLAGGEIKGAGVLPPEQAVDPGDFFPRLAKLGVRVARLDR